MFLSPAPGSPHPRTRLEHLGGRGEQFDVLPRRGGGALVRREIWPASTSACRSQPWVLTREKLAQPGRTTARAAVVRRPRSALSGQSTAAPVRRLGGARSRGGRKVGSRRPRSAGRGPRRPVAAEARQPARSPDGAAVGSSSGSELAADIRGNCLEVIGGSDFLRVVSPTSFRPPWPPASRRHSQCSSTRASLEQRRPVGSVRDQANVVEPVHGSRSTPVGSPSGSTISLRRSSLQVGGQAGPPPGGAKPSRPTAPR